nr:MAG TPA: hypothetical protein [Siphoviridae sp. ctIyp7]
MEKDYIEYLSYSIIVACKHSKGISSNFSNLKLKS